MALLNADLGKFIVGTGGAAGAVPRSGLSVPVSPIANPGDSTLFEDPTDAGKKFYLPRYRIADKPPLQLSLAQGASDWTLNVELEKYPAPELGGAGQTAGELPHTATVIVRYTDVVAGIIKELVLNEVTDEPHGIRTVLRGQQTALRDQLFLVMTDPRYSAALIVKRVASIAVPVPGTDQVVSSGQGTLRGTWSFSFDTGAEVGSGSSDVWWDQMTNVDRQLVPKAPAGIVNLGKANFDAINLATLQGYQYGSTPIPGSANATNQLTPGDVFAVRTSGGNYAKVQVISYDYNLGLRWTTYKPPAAQPVTPSGPVVSSGQGTLRGTWNFSFDAGGEVASGSQDVWWEQMTDVDRQLVPKASARIVNLGEANFDAINLATLQGYQYGSTPIPGSANATNQLTPGDVFAVRTSGGNYAKVQVIKYDYNLVLRWTTYDPSPATPAPDPAAYYQTTVYSDEERLAPDPFVFSTASYVFVNLGSVGGSFGLERNDVNFAGRSHSYYRDLSEPWVFYYLPDSFKLARRDGPPPHVPAMSVQIQATDDTLEDTSVTLTYLAMPYVDGARIADATTALKPQLVVGSLPASVTGPVLQALQADQQSITYSLSLPSAGAAAGFQVRDKAVVDLRAGIGDAITVTLADFQSIWTALFTNTELFRGRLEIRLGAGAIHTEHVDLIGRIDDMSGPAPLEITQHADDASNSVAAALTNVIESPAEIDSLTATLTRDGSDAAGTINGIDLSTPVHLDPGKAVNVVIVPTNSPPPGGGPLQGTFDLSGVTVLADPAAVWNSTLDTHSANHYIHTITLEVYQSAFTPPADHPGDSVQEVQVDFMQGTTVVVKPNQLPPAGAGSNAPEPMFSTPVQLHLPISDYVLNTPQYGQFQYTVTHVRISGSVTSDPITVSHSDIARIQ